MGVLPYYAGTGTMAEIPLNNDLLLFHYLALDQEWPSSASIIVAVLNILFIFVDILVVMNLFAL